MVQKGPEYLPGKLEQHATAAFHARAHPERYRGVHFQKDSKMASALLASDTPMTPAQRHALEQIASGSELQTLALEPISTPNRWGRTIGIGIASAAIVLFGGYKVTENVIDAWKASNEYLDAKFIPQVPGKEITIWGTDITVTIPDITKVDDMAEIRERRMAEAAEGFEDNAWEAAYWAGGTFLAIPIGGVGTYAAYKGARPWRQARRIQGWTRVARGWTRLWGSKFDREKVQDWYDTDGWKITEGNQPQQTAELDRELAWLVATLPETAADSPIPKGSMGMTADDHRERGSVPPVVLVDNPGRTRAELMSETQVLRSLRRQVKLVEDLRDPELEDVDFVQTALPDQEQLLQDNIIYLRHTRRLPQSLAS